MKMQQEKQKKIFIKMKQKYNITDTDEIEGINLEEINREIQEVKESI